MHGNRFAAQRHREAVVSEKGRQIRSTCEIAHAVLCLTTILLKIERNVAKIATDSSSGGGVLGKCAGAQEQGDAGRIDAVLVVRHYITQVTFLTDAEKGPKQAGGLLHG